MRIGRRVIYDNSAANSHAYFNLAGAGSVGTRGASNDRATITALPNGWYRCEVEFTTTTTTANPSIGLASADNVNVYLGDGVSGLYVWGAQYELGILATSPYPTFAASQVRAADQPSVLTSQIPWNDAESTMYAEYTLRAAPVGTGQYVMEIYLAASQRTAVHHVVTGTLHLVSAVTVTDINSAFGVAVPANVRQKVTLGVKANDTAASQNGAAPLIDTVCAVGTGYARINLGHYGAGTLQLNGWIEKFVHVPRRVPNADLPTWRYNVTLGDVHAVISRGSPTNYRRMGTRISGDRQALNVASDSTHDLTDTNTGTILSGPIVGAAGFEADGLKGRVFGLWTVPPGVAAAGTTAQTNAPITIGGNTATIPGEFLQGSVYHLFVCTDLTPSEYLQLEGWAAWDIGRPDVLDGSHPYRNIRP